MGKWLWAAAMVFALAGCEEEPPPAPPAAQAAPAQAATPQEGPAEGAVYECPMHCKLEGHDEPYTQKAPGECPVCGMELKPQSGE